MFPFAVVKDQAYQRLYPSVSGSMDQPGPAYT
jgi:hypothetical protein